MFARRPVDLLICRPQVPNDGEGRRFAGYGNNRRSHPERSRSWGKTMKHIASICILTAGLFVHSIANCAEDEHRASPDPTNPHVGVIYGKYLYVDQEPLHFVGDKKGVRKEITWHLPEGYHFTKRGIEIHRTKHERGDDKDEHRRPDASADIVECRIGSRPTEYRCIDKFEHEGTFKYSIEVEKDGGEKLPPLDPSGDNHLR